MLGGIAKPDTIRLTIVLCDSGRVARSLFCGCLAETRGQKFVTWLGGRGARAPFIITCTCTGKLYTVKYGSCEYDIYTLFWLSFSDCGVMFEFDEASSLLGPGNRLVTPRK